MATLAVSAGMADAAVPVVGMVEDDVKVGSAVLGDFTLIVVIVVVIVVVGPAPHDLGGADDEPLLKDDTSRLSAAENAPPDPSGPLVDDT